MFGTILRLVRATALAGLGGAIPAVLVGGTCLAKQTCTNQITVHGSQAMAAWVHVDNPANCDSSGGGYVKTGTQLRLDARAETDGACAWYGLSCWPCTCEYFISSGSTCIGSRFITIGGHQVALHRWTTTRARSSPWAASRCN